MTQCCCRAPAPASDPGRAVAPDFVLGYILDEHSAHTQSTHTRSLSAFDVTGGPPAAALVGEDKTRPVTRTE